ncbi:hypothetical protein C2G38_1696063 [Gigaspora rosea]|uniref:Uncharacterized protein n=1 Tax=Gigaspora rosea TaxID=44941 RepID=A0A397V3N3_9GLOM|nr:hypothetical protein C2G38_1696063 [Gigaspora rosea]
MVFFSFFSLLELTILVVSVSLVISVSVTLFMEFSGCHFGVCDFAVVKFFLVSISLR